MNERNEIILYQPDDVTKLEVRLENETVWLNRQQLSVLFDRDVKTIGKHIHNAQKEELSGISVVANFATTASDGKTYQVEYYNLDMILSVGYRVKSSRGVEFRRWANSVLREYMLRGYSINQRFERLEQRVAETENKIDFFVRTSLPPAEGIFYDGQIFDAYKFANDLIRSAQKSIVLIDNYIDDTVLLMLDKRQTNVTASILTKEINAKLQLDIKKHNMQYRTIEIQEFAKSHDRFLLVDDVVYHLGASLKDLGKRWFAFGKMAISASELLHKMNNDNETKQMK